MKYIITTFLLFTFIHSYRLEAQVIYNNDEGEFVCFDNDTITFKLANNDAFNIFGIGKGIFTFRKGQIRVKQLFRELPGTIGLKKRDSSQSVVFSVYSSSGKALKFATVRIMDLKTRKTQFVTKTDTNGHLILNPEQTTELVNNTIIFAIEYLGHGTEMQVTVDPDVHYVFTFLLDYSFTIVIEPNYLNIKMLSPSLISVKYLDNTRFLWLENIKQTSCGF